MKNQRAFKAVCEPWLTSVITVVAIYFSLILGTVYRPIGVILIVVHFAVYAIVIIFCYLSIYFRKTVEIGNPNDSLLKREKRLANTVAWILLNFVLTYFPSFLFPTVLVIKGFKNFLDFRPYYLIFYQLNGVLNPLLNFSRSKKIHKAVRDLFKCLPQVQPGSYVNNNNHNGARKP